MTKLHRRRLLKAGGLAAALPTRIFAQTSAASRPRLVQGVQSGDLMRDGAIVWSRADRPSRMLVEYATTESFVDAKRIMGPLALEATDFTARVQIRGVPPWQTVFYRVSHLDLGDYKTMSEPAVGHFRVPPGANNDVSFVWSGDTVGQGWGINPDDGGMFTACRMYKRGITRAVVRLDGDVGLAHLLGVSVRSSGRRKAGRDRHRHEVTSRHFIIVHGFTPCLNYIRSDSPAESSLARAAPYTFAVAAIASGMVSRTPHVFSAIRYSIRSK